MPIIPSMSEEKKDNIPSRSFLFIIFFIRSILIYLLLNFKIKEYTKVLKAFKLWFLKSLKWIFLIRQNIIILNTTRKCLSSISYANPPKKNIYDFVNFWYEKYRLIRNNIKLYLQKQFLKIPLNVCFLI